jgi:hypothetical protein
MVATSRELVVLIWEGNGYGLIERKMDLELGEHD